jgi:hypothetical protein
MLNNKVQIPPPIVKKNKHFRECSDSRHKRNSFPLDLAIKYSLQVHKNQVGGIDGHYSFVLFLASFHKCLKKPSNQRFSRAIPALLPAPVV